MRNMAKNVTRNTEFDKLAIAYRDQPLQIDYFLRHGHKETILYLHGLGCSKNDFIEAADVVELQSHTLVAFDFPGFGKSPYNQNISLGMDDLVEITNIVLSELNVPDCLIVGHSMGGLVGLLYAEKYSERVDGFINVEGNLTLEDCFFSGKIVRYGPSGFTKEMLKRLQRRLARSDKKGLQEHAKALQSASEKALSDCSFSMVDYSGNGNLVPRFTALDPPILFMHGSENRGLSYIPKLKDNGCEALEIPNSGHFPFYDNPQAYYQAISSFLDSVLSE